MSRQTTYLEFKPGDVIIVNNGIFGGGNIGIIIKKHKPQQQIYPGGTPFVIQFYFDKLIYTTNEIKKI